MFRSFFRKLFDIKKDFIITELKLYTDTSFGLKITSTMYTAVCQISGEVVCRYVYGAKLTEAQLKIALDKGNYPGKTYA